MAQPNRRPVETRIGIVLGWRCWFVLPHEGLLRPIYMKGMAWKPRQPLEAVCPEQLHQVPADGCKCGVWAVCHPMLLHETTWAAPGGAKSVVVVGQNAMWGTIVAHERGWRSSCAYPTQLYAFTDDELLGQTLRERYMVPVSWGAEADLIRAVLPAAFERHLPPARTTTGPIPAPVIGGGIGLESLGILEMVRNQEAEGLERLRQETEQARAQLDEERRRLEEERGSIEQLRALQEGQLAQIREARRALAIERQRGEVARFKAQPYGPQYARLVSLAQQLSAQGITHDHVAAEAGVNRTMVCNVLRGRATSANVLQTIERLLSAQASPAKLGTRIERLTQLETIRQKLAALGITNREVAAEASLTSRRGHVGDTTVSHTLAGRGQSANVLAAAARLIEQRTSPLAQVQARLAELGWSQNELARRIGKNPGLVSKVLSGQVTSSVVWGKVAKVLSLVTLQEKEDLT